jgi:hypothetical protein
VALLKQPGRQTPIFEKLVLEGRRPRRHAAPRQVALERRSMAEQERQPGAEANGRTARHRADAAIVHFLARGCSVAQVASLAGCSARTVNRRLNSLRQQVDDARREMFANAAGRLTFYLDEAIEELHRLMTSSESDKIKLTAARVIVENAVKFRECAEGEERLAALRRRVEEVEGDE